MKVLFVGPSLAGTAYPSNGIEVRGPAANGDVTRAVLEGASVIGLVDGVFGSIAAVWHKEILFALDRGVQVLGSSSMGALRAAECASFGMVPIGTIAARYLSGELDDDAAVALTHLPGEMGWTPLTEALVDAEATIALLAEQGSIGQQEARCLLAAARALFFKDRTVSAIIGQAELPAEREAAISALYRSHRRSLKREDALELVSHMASMHLLEPVWPTEWVLAQPPMWQRRLAGIQTSTPDSPDLSDRSRSVHAS